MLEEIRETLISPLSKALRFLEFFFISHFFSFQMKNEGGQRESLPFFISLTFFFYLFRSFLIPFITVLFDNTSPFLFLFFILFDCSFCAIRIQSVNNCFHWKSINNECLFVSILLIFSCCCCYRYLERIVLRR